MFITPAALELALRCPFSLGGDDDRPSTAESTFVRGSVMLEVCVLRSDMSDQEFIMDSYKATRSISVQSASDGSRECSSVTAFDEMRAECVFDDAGGGTNL